MKISIIVPAFNEEKLLTETLRHIKAAAGVFAKRQWEHEIVVCDNNSTDRTGEIARSERAVVVFEPVNQISRARNRGAEGAKGDWLVFIDADSRPSPDLLNDLADHIATGRYIGGGATVKLDQDLFVASLVTRGWNLLSRMRKWAAGSFVFCEATAFRELGGFSLKLYASEELEFSERLKKYGREHGKKMVILKRYPLVTSARKMHLYTPREHLRFLGRTVLSRGKTLEEREACVVWYDGRR